MASGDLTVRERIMRQFERNLEGMRKGVDGYNTTFKHVTRETISLSQTLLVPAVSILDVSSRITDGVGFITHNTRVQLEAFIDRPVSKKTSGSQEANIVLGDMQRLFLNNLYTTEEGTGVNLTTNVQMVFDEFSFGEFDDKRIIILLELDVLFRHNKQDPTDIKPGGQ